MLYSLLLLFLLAAKPNIVLIVTDDQAWHTMQFMPKTNALIGDKGIRFTNAFASTPLCCPSRASILSGQYSHTHGVRGNQHASLFADTTALPTWLQQAGYRTGYFGKYLNTYSTFTPWPYVPRGWSTWKALKEPGYLRYYLVEAYPKRETYYPNYSTSLLAEKAVTFIQGTARGQRMFLYFAPFAPHAPAIPDTQDAGRFAGLPGWRSPSYNEEDTSDKPGWLKKYPLLTKARRDSTDALYRRQVESLQAVDRAVASIVTALSKAGRLANTVIIYTSDNGLSLGAHRWTEKNCVYEECVRVPLLVRGPGILPRTDENLVLNVDLAPSIAEWAGAVPTIQMDGQSFVELTTDPTAPWRDSVLLEALWGQTGTRYQAVRTDRYVYAEYMNEDLELYDLLSDPYQLQNVAEDPAYAPVRAEMKVKLELLRQGQ